MDARSAGRANHANPSSILPAKLMSKSAPKPKPEPPPAEAIPIVPPPTEPPALPEEQPKPMRVRVLLPMVEEIDGELGYLPVGAVVALPAERVAALGIHVEPVA